MKLSKELSSSQINYLKNVLESKRGIVKDSYTKVAPRSRAIKSKCLDCSNYVMEEVANCNIDSCPLWNYRPYQKRAINEQSK